MTGGKRTGLRQLTDPVSEIHASFTFSSFSYFLVAFTFKQFKK